MKTERAPDKLTQLSIRLNEAKTLANNFEGRRSILIDQKAAAIIEIQNAQHYLAHKEEVLNFLNVLQESAQQKTKKMYEDLLTSLIREVLPHKKDKIVFETSIKNNKMSLDINILANGKLLNVVKDKGGTIQNIVSMGLRFITVARSRNRKIILLDEADHWLKSKYIPKFARIVRKLAEELSVQVIYISHHSPEAFSSNAKVVTLIEKEGLVYCHESSSPNIAIDEIGVRYIRLQSFKNHTDTIINLDKYVTVITGEGDIGKSSVIEAFSIVMNNEGRDAIARDGVKCSIEIGIEEGRTIAYEYNIKKDLKTSYRLMECDGTITEESNDGRNKPLWLDTYLATPKVGDFDIHISSQSSSNFILDSNYTSQKRAEILALDNEAEQIQKIIKLHSEKTAIYQKSLSNLNKTLNSTKELLSKMNNLHRVFELLEICQNQESNSKLFSQNLKNITCNGSKLAFCIKKTEALSNIKNYETSDTAIDIESGSMLRRNITSLTSIHHKIESISKVEFIEPISKFELTPLSPISKAGAILRIANEKVKALDAIRNIKIMESSELSPLLKRELIVSLEKLHKKHVLLQEICSVKPFQDIKIIDPYRIDQLANQLKVSRASLSSITSATETAKIEMEQTKQEIIDIEKQLGKCPLCESNFHSACGDL